MKRFLLFIICILITLLSLCQTGIVNKGAIIKLSNNTYVSVNGNNAGITNLNNGAATGKLYNRGMISVSGNWTNNGVFPLLSGTVVFTGGSSSLSGSSVSSFNIVYINKSSNNESVRLNTNITISKRIIMTSGDVFLNNQNINLGETGEIINETNSNKIYDDYATGTGTITASRTGLTPVSGENFGNIGVVITSGQYFGNTVITRGHKYQTSAETGGSSIGRYFDVSTESTGDLFASMRFSYLDDEVPSGMNEADFSLYKSVDNGLTWTNQSGTVILESNTIEQTDIKQFCRYTVSDKYVSPLPIDLIDFTATHKNSVVFLNWITRTEINNKGFDVERSTDLYLWEKIGFVEGSGNSNSIHNYSYNDLTDGISDDVQIIYYRLKQIDFDGKYKHTELKAVELENEISEITMSLYPNPATDVVNIVSNAPETEWLVQILNISGKLISSVVLTNSTEIELSDIPQGLYQIVISNEEKGVGYIKKLVVL